MKKHKHYQKLTNALDEQQYERLKRQSEPVANVVEAMVSDGIEPGEIRRFVNREYPNLWIEARTIEQAARHCYVKGES